MRKGSVEIVNPRPQVDIVRLRHIIRFICTTSPRPMSRNDWPNMSIDKQCYTSLARAHRPVTRHGPLIISTFVKLNIYDSIIPNWEIYENNHKIFVIFIINPLNFFLSTLAKYRLFSPNYPSLQTKNNFRQTKGSFPLLNHQPTATIKDNDKSEIRL